MTVETRMRMDEKDSMRPLSNPLTAMTRVTACLLIMLVVAALIIPDYPDLPVYEGPSPFLIKTLPTQDHVTVQQPEFLRKVGLSRYQTEDRTDLDARHCTVGITSQLICLSLPLVI